MAVVSSGMYMSGMTLQSGAQTRLMHVNDRGLAENINVISAGYIYVNSGGRLENATIGPDNTVLIVNSGGIANNIIGSGGMIHVKSGGVIMNHHRINHNNDPYSGQTYISAGGTGIDCSATSNYYLCCHSGATLLRPVLYTRGQIQGTNSASYIKDLIVSGGMCSAGGTLDGANIVYGETRISGLGYNVNVGGHTSSALCHVATVNGRAYNVHIYSNGKLFVSSGAHAYNVTKEANGYTYILSGGVLDGGYMAKHGSVSDYPVISSGGIIRNVTFDITPNCNPGGIIEHCTINSAMIVSSRTTLRDCTIKMGTSGCATGASATYENTKFIGPPTASHWLVSSASTMSNTIVDNAVVVIYDSLVDGLTLKGGSAATTFYNTTSGSNVDMQAGKMTIMPDASVKDVNITSGVLTISGVASNVTRVASGYITTSAGQYDNQIFIKGGTVYGLKSYGGGPGIHGVDISAAGVVDGFVGGDIVDPAVSGTHQYTYVDGATLTNFQQIGGWIYVSGTDGVAYNGKTSNVFLRAGNNGVIHDVTAVGNSAHVMGIANAAGTIRNCTFYGVNNLASGSTTLISGCTMYPNGTAAGVVTAVSGGTIANCDIDSCSTYVSSGGYMESCTIRHCNAVIGSGGSAEHIVRATASNGTTGSSFIRGGTITDFVGCPGAPIYNSGGLIDGLITPGYVYISNGGIVRNAKMTTSQGGAFPRMYVYSGCVVSGGVTYDSGQIIVSSNGLAISCVMSGGFMYASNGGTISSSTIRGGQMSAAAGGVIKDITISGGAMYCQWGGECFNVAISSGGLLRINGAATPMKGGNNLVIHPGGSCGIWPGCSGNEIVVSSNGTLIVSSAGLATNVTSKAGAIVTVITGGTITYK